MGEGEGRRRYRALMDDSARWEDVELRDDDIVIATPAKCGTTWMQMMCALLVFQDTTLPGLLTELSPWVDVQTESIESVRASLAAQTHRRFIKSHTPLDGLPRHPGVTYITVGRDPRDVALSWDNHFWNMDLGVVFTARAEAVGMDDLAEFFPDGFPPPPPEDPVERFWAWVDNDDLPNVSGLRGMLHHLATFWDRRDEPGVVLFHYADLQADLDGEMRRLAGTLGIEVDEERWPSLVEAATFERMQARADELAPQVGVDGFWKDPSRFFERARREGWREFLDDEGVARYEARVASLVKPDLAAWVHGGSSRRSSSS